ncbi:MAG TPA: efflux RND transporter permease subunit [Candidatus Acidoferrum sp.]
MWIVRVALDRPYTFIVLAILILVLSPVMILRTPTDIFPNINIPVIAVAWQYTGMNPEELEGRLTSVYDTTRVQDTDVTVQRAQFEHAIAILIGKPPAEFSLQEAPLNDQAPTIPIGLPSDLLQRRPDIAAAERRVAGANQQIGIARAGYFPTVTLDGTAGFSGSRASNWFTWAQCVLGCWSGPCTDII